MRTTRTPALAAFAAGRTLGPIGYRRNGSPIFAIAGGAPDDDSGGGDDKSGGNDSGQQDTANKYTPPATQADLDRIIGERVARERAKFADYPEIKSKADEHDKALEAARTEQEKAVEKAKAEGRTEALTTANTRLIGAEARALAAEARFRNPALAVRSVDLSSVKVNDDGTVDTDAIKAELKTLADAEPYLVDDGKKPAPKSDKSQGGGRTNDSPSVSRGREMFESRRGGTKTA